MMAHPASWNWMRLKIGVARTFQCMLATFLVTSNVPTKVAYKRMTRSDWPIMKFTGARKITTKDVAHTGR